MASPRIRDDVRRIAAGERPSRTPFFAISQEFDAAHYGVTYREYLSDAETMFRAQARAIRDFDYDWALFQLHDALEFAALGLKVTRDEENILPGVASSLPIEEETIRRLRVPDFRALPEIRVFLDAIRMTRREFGDDALVVGRLAAPFTSAVLLHGISETMLALADPCQRDLVLRTARFFEELQYAFFLEQREAGAHAIWLGDCLASSKFISLAMHRDLAFDGNRSLVRRLRDAGAYVFFEPADDRPDFIRLYAEEGIDAVNVGIALDMAEAKAQLRGACGLMGNLDAIRFLQNGTPEETAEETARIVRAGRPGGGYAFCTDSVPRFARPENVRAMSQAVRAEG